MIIRVLGEFMDCRWTDDDALVITDMDGADRLRIWFASKRALSRPERLAMLLDLVDSRAVCGGPPACVNLDGTEPQR